MRLCSSQRRYPRPAADRRPRTAAVLAVFMLSALAASALPCGAGDGVREAGPEYGGRLVGTLAGPGLSGAVFENAAGEQKFYRAGVAFADGSRIVEVRPKSIVVRTAGGELIEYHTAGGKPGRLAAAPSAPPAAEEGADTGAPHGAGWQGGAGADHAEAQQGEGQKQAKEEARERGRLYDGPDLADEGDKGRKKRALREQLRKERPGRKALR